ncbi:MAG: tetratricopeptide repeat protein [Muribaculaceae bacterium]|nr:tetratricopeptide repeat protein [Muribaculaceae bacterium]
MKLHFTIFLFLVALFPSLSLSNKHSDYDLKKHYYRQKGLDRTLDYKARLNFLDSLAMGSDKIEKPLHFMEIAKLAEENLDYPIAAKYYEEAFRAFPNDSVRMQAMAASGAANSWFRQYRYRECLKWNTVNLTIHKPDSLLWIDIVSIAELIGICDAYNLSTLYTELLEIMNKKVERLSKSNANADRKGIGMARYYNSLGNYKHSRKDYKGALDAFGKITKVSKDSDMYYTSLINLGFTYCYMNRPDLARPLLEEVIRGQNPHKFIAAVNLCYAYNLLGMTDSTENVLKRVIEPMQIPLESGLNHFPLLIKGVISAQRGDYETAYKNICDGHIIFREALNNGDYLFAADIEKSIREAANIPLTKWYKKPGLLGWCFICLLVAFLINIFLFLLSFRQIKIKRAIIGKMEESNYDRLIQKYQNLSMEKIMTREKSKVENLTVENIHLREILHSIEKEASNSKSHKALASAIHSVMKNISMTTTAIGNKMQLHEQTDQMFMQTLCNVHPDLTKAEREICAYISIGFSPKEIAITTNRSIKTINTLRHRIRKKLALSPSISIDTYLLKLKGSNNTI